MKETFTVAIIDDNKYYARTMGDIFEERGATVVVFDSYEALLEGSSVEYDIYVTDTNLGSGRDGFACASAIRSMHQKAYIVGSSAIDTWEDIPQQVDELRTLYRRMGADDFINSNTEEGLSAIVTYILQQFSDRH